VAGMVVGDVDLSAKRVWVRQPVVEVEGRLVRNATPKGGRNRAVIVGPQLAQLLREHLGRRDQPQPNAPLLTSVNGAGFRWNGLSYLSGTRRDDETPQYDEPTINRSLCSESVPTRALAQWASRAEYPGESRLSEPMASMHARPQGSPYSPANVRSFGLQF
jgi:hypothetical protein